MESLLGIPVKNTLKFRSNRKIRQRKVGGISIVAVIRYSVVFKGYFEVVGLQVTFPYNVPDTRKRERKGNVETFVNKATVILKSIFLCCSDI